MLGSHMKDASGSKMDGPTVDAPSDAYTSDIFVPLRQNTSKLASSPNTEILHAPPSTSIPSFLRFRLYDVPPTVF